MTHLTREELEQRFKELECILPLNEMIHSPIENYYDSITQRSDIIAEENRNQKQLIQDLKMQVEDLTRIVNVIAPLAMKYNKRKLNINGN